MIHPFRSAFRSLPGQLALAFGGAGALTLALGALTLALLAHQDRAGQDASRAVRHTMRQLATAERTMTGMRLALDRAERDPSDAAAAMTAVRTPSAAALPFVAHALATGAPARAASSDFDARWTALARAWGDTRSAVLGGSPANEAARTAGLLPTLDALDADVTVALDRETGALERGEAGWRSWLPTSPSLLFGFVLLALATALASVRLISRSVTRRISVLVESTEQIAAGALGGRLPVQGADEIARLASSFNRMTAQLAGEMARMRRTVAYLESRSGELTDVAARQNGALMAQAGNVTDITATVEELSRSARTVEENAIATADRACVALAAARDGRGAVVQGVQEMRGIREKVGVVTARLADLAEKTRLISDIVDMVRGIAAKTDMLAINAAVEAARAGVEGRGFAVVASEVRKLSDQSQRATEKIAGMLAEIQMATAGTVAATEESARSVGEGVRLLERTGEAIDALHTTLGEAVAAVQEIATTAQQQALGVSQVAEGMTGVNDGMYGARDASAEVLRVAEGLAELATELTRAVAQYRSEDSEAGAVALAQAA